MDNNERVGKLEEVASEILMDTHKLNEKVLSIEQQVHNIEHNVNDIEQGVNGLTHRLDGL